jgi:hypothetical protein
MPLHAPRHDGSPPPRARVLLTSGAMDKRTGPRRKTRLPARFGAERTERLGMVTDVSARGLYVQTNAVLSRGSEVRVQVRTPGGDPLELQGRVMRTRRVAAALVTIATGGMGVRLSDPPADWRARFSLPEES